MKFKHFRKICCLFHAFALVNKIQAISGYTLLLQGFFENDAVKIPALLELDKLAHGKQMAATFLQLHNPVNMLQEIPSYELGRIGPQDSRVGLLRMMSWR